MVKVLTIKRFLNILGKHPEYVKYYRKNLLFPFYLDQTLKGLMLSDGSLQKYSDASLPRLSVSFSLKNISYLLHIYNLFEPYVNTGPDILKVYNKKTDSYNYVSKFKTVSLPQLLYYYKMFYKKDSNGKYKKIVPLNSHNLITPISLAHLIMGDGNLKKGEKIIRIYTNNFTFKEVTELSFKINELGFNSEPKHYRKSQYIIIFKKADFYKLKRMLYPYMHISMLYKLGLNYKNCSNFKYSNIIKDI